MREEGELALVSKEEAYASLGPNASKSSRGPQRPGYIDNRERRVRTVNMSTRAAASLCRVRYRTLCPYLCVYLLKRLRFV